MPENTDNPAIKDIHTHIAENFDVVYNPALIKQMTTEQLVQMRYDFEVLSDNFIRFF